MAKKPADPVKLNLRFTEGLRARLEKQALKNNHSLNAEIVRRLEQSFEQADRIAILREEVEKRIEDEKARASDEKRRQLEEVAAIRKQAEEEAQAGYERARQDAERHYAAVQREFDRRGAELTRAAAVVDVLLGGSKLKSDFFRSLVLEFADLTEDCLSDKSNRRQLVERAVAGMERRTGAAAQ
jgi:hypothetical protein